MLVVEDDPASASALSTILRRLGMEIKVTATVSDALAALAVERPDVVLLDLMLPDGDGEQILSHVREHLPGTRVYVLTACSDLTRLKKLNLLKPDSILAKPIDLGRLLAELKN